MMVPHLLLAVFWITYAVLHSVLASAGIKKYLKRKWKKASAYYLFFYNVFALSGLVAIIWYQVSMDSFYLFSPSIILQLTGSIIGGAGIVLMAICIKKYFTGLSGLLSLKQKDELPQLLISGVHRYVRHPLYLGTFAFVWGMWIMVPLLSLLIATSIITIYTLIGIELEEKKLLASFGSDYEAYQKTVPKIIPKL